MARKKEIVKDKIEAPVAGTTVTPKITARQARNMFIEKVGKRIDDGSSRNNTLDAFLIVMDRVMSTLGSFSLPDVINAAKAYDLPVDQIISLFDRYVHHLEMLNRVQRIVGPYDYDVFLTT